MTLRKNDHRWQALGSAAMVLLPLGWAVLSEAAPATRKGAAPVKTVAVPAISRAGAAPGVPAAKGKLQYNRDIRPILSDNCFACHGADSAARKADLRLDRFADATAVRDGHAAIVKGKPAASELVKRIMGDGPLMPPASTHKTLTAQQIATLKRWVAEGAEYEAHWSFLPPQKAALPSVSNPKWCRSPIDNFVLAKLDAVGLKPAPEADRRTLARRVSLDLTGLPPEPADVEAFVNDRSPNAYEKLVDKYLASSQWGEHRGRFWLDAARYGDTHGIHIDNYREIWSYRDWVIQAFNKNMPFDRFTTEQLAGDLLPKPTLDQVVATGFVRCNITTSEGGAIADEYAVLYARDRTETAGQVFMGSTVGCAVCHDHKFDPISQREFYQLAAYFNNTTQNPMDGNVKDTPPILPVPMPEDRDRFEQVTSELKVAREQAEARKQSARGEFDRWMGGTAAQTVVTVPTQGLKLHVPLSDGSGQAIAAKLDGSDIQLKAATEPGWAVGKVSAKAFQRRAGSVVEVPTAGDWEKDQSFSYGAWVMIPNVNQSGAIVSRIDDQHDFRGWDLWLEGGKVGTHIVNKWPDDALKVVTREQLKPKVWHHVFVTYNGAANPGALQVFIDGTARPTDVQANTLKNSIRTTVPFKIGQRHSTSGVDGTGIADVRLYDRALSQAEVQQISSGTRAAWLVSRGAAILSSAEKDELFTWWLPGQDEQFRSLTSKVAALENDERTIRLRGTIAHVAQERSEEAMAYILFRGEYDQRRDPVKPGTPAALPAMPSDYPRNRLGLAKWLLLPQHPLTTRVTVNRFWQELFGQGIVRTTGDFGITGDLPANQALLDWLAVDFRENHWDIKRFFKQVVLSSTYRQASITTPEKRLKDRENRLLSRGPRYRMDAEMIRDYALASSGLLVKKIGGPSVKPYQPDGVWEAVAMIGSNTRDYKRDIGENLYRRSMYTFWKRSAPPASMEIFNAPSRETCTVRRERTNTPLQALVTLNDIQFIEAARNLAQRTLKEGGATSQSRIDFLSRRLVARPLNANEQAVAARSLMELESFYKGHAKEAKELITVGESKAAPALQPEQLAAWTMLVNQFMNLDEVLNK